MADLSNKDGFESPISKKDPAWGQIESKSSKKGGEFQSPVTSGDKSEASEHKNG